LGAKIGVVILLSALAWGFIFAGIGLLQLRVRNYFQRAIYVGAGIGFIALAACVWGWTGG